MKIDPNNLDQARESALRFLTYREHSTKELRRKLQKKGFNEEILEILLSRLKEIALLDDERFAKMWLESRIRKGTLGRHRIIQELRQKGISTSIIKTLLETEFDYETELKLAIKQLEKKLHTIREDDNQKRRSKLYNFLRRRGFDNELILQALQKVDSR